MALTYYDIAKFTPNRRERKIVVCGEKGTPELNILAPKVQPGTEYETPRLREQGDADIWVKYGEGACDLKTDFDMVTTKAYGIDVKATVPVRVLDAENSMKSPLGMSRFDFQMVAHTANIRRKLVKQLDLGQKNGHIHGMVGFPDMAIYAIDALSKEWNGHTADFVLADGQENQVTDVYLVKAAPSAEADGLALFWGNNRTLRFGEPNRIEVDDPDKPGCSHEAIVRHIYADAGLQGYCNQDVIRIANVPLFKLKDFSLDTVLSRAYSVFTDEWKPTHVLMHSLAYQAWWETRQNNKNDGATIQTPSADGSFGGRFATWQPFNLPIIGSENPPIKSVETIETQSLKSLFEQVRDEADVPA